LTAYIRIVIIVSCCIKVLEEMHWNTHDRLSGMMRPGADPKVIYRLNRAMDNPDPWAIALNNYMKKSGYGNTGMFPGLGNTGIESRTITG
jgi:hypothetical protein